MSEESNLSKPTWDFPNPGRVFPGCSIPIGIARQESGDTTYQFAFDTHTAWPQGTLNRGQQKQLCDDLVTLLRCLDELHRGGIHYGRISRKTFCDRGTSSRHLAMIHVNPALMDSANEITGGHEEERFWLPERVASGRPPTVGDDLYALGVVLADLVLGPARLDNIWTATSDKNQFSATLSKNIRRSSSHPPLKNLVLWLLDAWHDNQARASDGIPLLQTSARRTSFATIAVVAIIGVLATSYTWYRGDAQAKQLVSDLSSLKETLAEREDELDQRDLRLREQKSRLRDLEDQIAETGETPLVRPVPRPDLGRDFWDTQVADDKVLSTLQKLSRNRGLAEPDEQNVVDAWGDKLRDAMQQNKNLDQWFAHDRRLKELVKLAINRPWDADFDALSQRSLGLQAAYKTWNQWAQSQNSFEDLSRLHSRMPAGIPKDVLGIWLNEVESLDSIKLKFSSGTTSAPTQVGHKLFIESGTEKTSKTWDWKSASRSNNSITMSVSPYRAGQSVRIWLGQTGYVYNSYVIDVQLAGPLVPWVFGKPKILYADDKSYRMAIECLDSVGPPHIAKTKIELPPSLKKSTQKAAQSRVGARPEYDPLKALP